MEQADEMKCPNCGRLNQVGADKCFCGYYFNVLKYKEGERFEDKTPNHNVSKMEYPFLNAIIIIFYIVGCSLILVGIGILFTYFTHQNKEEFAISVITGHWISGLSMILAGLFQLGFAEFLKVVIKIENNTRLR